MPWWWSRRSRRLERISALELPPGQWERAWANLRRRDLLGRIALAVLAAVCICQIIHGWEPPFAFRTGYVPPRNITATVAFQKADVVATQAARQRAKAQARYVYLQDAAPLVQLRAQLRNTLVELTTAESLKDVSPQMWGEFQLRKDESQLVDPAKQAEEFQAFRKALTQQGALERVEKALAEVFAPFEERGLLDKLSQDLGPGNQEEIVVYPRGRPEAREVIRISDVLIGDGAALRESMQQQPVLEPLAERLFAWLRPRLVSTLTVDDQRTKQNMEDAAEAVEEVFVEYAVGQTLAPAGKPLGKEQLELLRLEYRHALEQRTFWQRASRMTAVMFLCFAAFLLCGVYMRYRQQGPLANITQLIVLMLMSMATVAVARLAAEDQWRAESVPLLLFGMTAAIVYQREMALLLSGVLAMLIVLAAGSGLGGFLSLLAVTAAAVLNLDSIRTRSKLIYVCLFAAAVAFLWHLATNLLDNQPFSRQLVREAFFSGLWAVAAGFIMTGLLPFIERAFGVLTDLSLLELGDVAHPLLQELVRRAPSTYNHSLTVGAIAEAAAESIHARGLLVRVGAYFHDVGKMLKPDYFIENQGPDEDRHQGLVPAMSTLVIIAHIKDGADLARQHRLPQPIIDLIVQHHGTTRVEYFYERAAEQQQHGPNGSAVDESIYRYPGPKPQTKEAAVLMLADAVESASRTLVDPAPARIESLVREIAENRLDGGQFDESGLTLRELRTIERSMVMSLTSIYHARIKYPEPKPA